MASSSASTPSSVDQGQTVVLKKYGNRRLYDTTASRYVTLDEVQGMVQRGIDIQVRDAKTNEDLTKEILVQIILDKEGAQEVLPTAFLKQVVRLSASPVKETFTRALQETLDGFLHTQRAWFDAQRSFLQQGLQQQNAALHNVASGASTPFSAMGGSMANLFNPLGAFAAPAPKIGHAPAPAAAPDGKDQELMALKREMSETQAMLRTLIERGENRAPAKKKKKR